MDRWIEITKGEIEISQANEFLTHHSCGGSCIFVGNVRDLSHGKKVLYLEFEAYQNMAVRMMESLVSKAGDRWNLEKVVVVHAVGKKEIGEIVVLIGSSSPHRDAAFQATRFLIDELKKEVPIWKKEFFEDESVWVNAHP